MSVDWNGFCHRCGGRTTCYSMSFLNTQLCCMGCLDKEKEHPRYVEARKVEEGQLRAGNRDYPGLLSNQVITARNGGVEHQFIKDVGGCSENYN